MSAWEKEEHKDDWKTELRVRKDIKPISRCEAWAQQATYMQKAMMSLIEPKEKTDAALSQMIIDKRSTVEGG